MNAFYPRFVLFAFLLCSGSAGMAYTRQDTLRGSNGRGRDWWDVIKYELNVTIDTATRTIRGSNTMTIRITGQPRDSMQLDLQEGMRLTPQKDLDGKEWSWPREGNVYWIDKGAQAWEQGRTYKIQFDFDGKPHNAINPPWDGGFIWTKDSTGKPWIAVACQGLGASSWWPCKDYQGDEPDSGMKIRINYPDPYKVVSNGRFAEVDTIMQEEPLTGRMNRITVRDAFAWNVRNPINTYSATFYIGDYAHWHDTLHGEKGTLDLDFYPLRCNETKARKQWAVTKQMLRCYEHWMGPYPFYEDGYKLVEAPFLGMEHQSAVAYGNQYKMGYNGRGLHKDRSGTGVGFLFDFIIIHESGHEWFGNNITARDVADNWLHEGFTTYAETLFAEWIKGKDSAYAYAKGEWNNIKNDRPVIGDYGVNNGGSADKYDKGAAVVHMIRLMIGDDKQFRELLRGLNRDFYHRIVSSRQVENYISRFVGVELKPFFDQYLRTIKKPVLEWYIEGDSLAYRWQSAVPDFVAPCLIQSGTRSRYFNSYPVPTKVSLYGVKPSEIKVVAIGWYDVVERKF